MTTVQAWQFARITVEAQHDAAGAALRVDAQDVSVGRMHAGEAEVCTGSRRLLRFLTRALLLTLLALGAESIRAAGPDLIVVSGWAGVSPTTIAPGGSLTIKEWTVKNQGTAAAGSFTNGFYLSSDSTISTGDVLLDQTSNSGLAAGATFSYPSSVVTIPYTTSPGTYYVGILVDKDNAVVESSDSNNTAKVSITVSGPDLSFGTSPAFSPSKVAPGGPVSVAAWSIKNTGAADASGFTVTYYLSPNSTIDASDVPLDSFYISGLAAGATSPVTAGTLNVPSGTVAGSYYVGVMLDSGGAVAEVSETNNTRSTALTVSSGPDLTVTGTLTATPTKVAPGSTVTIAQISIKNSGTGDASSFSAGYFLSTNSTIDTTDIALGTVPVSSLAAGASTNLPGIVLTIPSNVVPGSYYVGLFLDPDNAIPESLESNNTKSTSLVVSSGPDLTVTGAVTLTPTKVAPGGSVSVAAIAIKNIGTGDSGPFSTSYYLSSNSTIETTDILLATVESAGLAAGAAANLPSISLTIPANVAPGSYYVGVFLDPGNAVAESDETNNTRSSSLTVASGPDLIINGSLTVTPTKVAPGGTLNVAAIAIKNIGVGDASAFSTGYFLSTSSTPDPKDRLLASVSSEKLAAGASVTLPATTLPVPSDVPPGSYRIRIYTDPSDSIAESNEANNSASVAITVSAGPDLTVTGAMSLSASSVAPGGTVSISGLSVKNQGTVESPSTTVGFFLSQDSVLDLAKDQLLDSRSVGSLAVGASSPLGSVTVTLPTGIPDGSYFLGVWVDPANDIAESTETNNTLVKSFSLASCSSGLRVSLVQVDTSSCSTVRVILSVTDSFGKPVTGLGKSSFCLKEDGQDQDFSLSTAVSSVSDVSLAIALDNSSSLSSSAFADEKSATSRLIGLLPASNQIALYSFATQVAQVRNFTADRSALSAALSGLAYQSQGLDTALYDACIEAVEAVGSRPGLHGVVVMTDGLDDASAGSQSAVISRAQSFQVPVYTIGFGTADPGVLRSIAESTGGTYYPSSSSANLQQIATDLGQEISSHYILTYTTSRADGNTHGLEICVGDTACRQQVTTSVWCPSSGGGGGTVDPPTITSLTASSYSPTIGQTVEFACNAVQGGAPIASYEWILDAGVSRSTSSNTTSYSYSSAGTKNFQCVVKDTAGRSSSPIADHLTVYDAGGSTCDFVINDEAGTRIAFDTTTQRYSAANGQRLTFVASGVTGGVDWNFGDYQTGSGNPVTHTYSAAGSYVVTIHAGNCSKSYGIDIREPAGLGFTITDAATGMPLALEGGAYLASAGQILRFQATGTTGLVTWDFGDGTTSAELSPTKVFAPLVDTTYVVTLRGGGQSKQGVLKVKGSTGAVLTGNYTYSYADGSSIALGQVVMNKVIRFSAVDQATEYVWDFGDGTALAAGSPVEHAFSRAGTFTVKLTVARTPWAGPVTSPSPTTFTVLATHEPLLWVAAGMAYVDGSKGELFQSDLTVFNPATQAATVSLAFVSGSGWSGSSNVAWIQKAVAPGGSLTFSNVLWTAFGLDKGAWGVVLIRGDNVPVAPVIVSRTYNAAFPELGSFGLSVPVVSVASGLRPQSGAASRFLTGLR